MKQYFKGHHHLVGNNENLRDCLDPAEGRSPGRGCQAANQVWRQVMELLSVRWSYHPSIHCMDEEAVLYPIFGGKRELSSIYCRDQKALSLSDVRRKYKAGGVQR